MLIVMVEHIIILLKLLISIIIPDKPSWVSREEHEQDEQMESLFDMLDVKEKEFRDKGGVPINDMVQAINIEKYGE